MQILRTRFLPVAIAAGTLNALAGAQQIRFVDANLTSGANDGTSWANAHQGSDGLQVAIGATVPGDQVFVADGVYLPTTTGARGMSFRPQDDVTIYGGFLGGENSPDERPPFDSAPSILSGDLQGDDGSGMITDNSYHLLRLGGTSSTAIIDGFRIVAGNSDTSGSNRDRGGGVLAINNAQGVVRNCRFVGNRCIFGGGAGYVAGSAPTFINCRFEDNIGGAFGGAFDIAGSTTVLFDGCYFRGNSAARAGALEVFSTNGTRVLNSIFINNTATGTGANGGGGIWVGAGSNPEIRNCTIVGNTSPTAAGITVTASNPTIVNCIVWDNQDAAGNQSPANQVSQGANVTYSIVEGGMAGTGNSGGDPGFADLAAGDLRLTDASAAVDAGNNSALPTGFTVDFDGNDRFVDIATVPDTGNGTAPVIDMGAFELQNDAGIGMLDPGCVPLANSTGSPSILTATGSLLVADNNLNLSVNSLPNNQFGYFILSQSTGNASLASGTLCLGAPFIRFINDVLNSGAGGSVDFSPNFANLPQGQVFQTGQTWYFQLWHRDAGATSNLSNSLGFTWQ